MYEKELDRELENLSKRGVPREIVRVIRKFNDDLRMASKPISAGRRYSYVIRLRKFAKMIPKKFLNPSERDLKLVMEEIRSTEVKWGSGPPHKPTNSSIQSYYMTLKKFYKWYLGKGKTYPKCVEWIRLGKSSTSRQEEPEFLIAPDEVRSLIEACENPRDRAMLATLYDSGARLGEILNMKVNGVIFDSYGAILRVPKGKTGFRQVRVVGNSIPYLNQWLSVHPEKKNGESPLFCNLSEEKGGRKMEPPAVYAVIKNAKKRANITKRIHPHLFRHTRATILASKVAEAPLEDQMGWVHGSDQTRIYVHLSLRDQDNAILKAYGVDVKDDGHIQEERFKTCPRCHKETPSNSMYCITCGLPMDVKTALDIDAKEKKVTEALIGSGAIDNVLIEVLKSIPESSKLQALVTVLENIVKEPEKKEKVKTQLARLLSDEET
jgi:integrase